MVLGGSHVAGLVGNAVGTPIVPVQPTPQLLNALGPDPILTSNDITAAPAGYTGYDWIPNFLVRYGPTNWTLQSGDWNNPLTWANGVPTAADNVAIRRGHAITWKTGYTVYANILGILDGGSLTASVNPGDALNMSVLTLMVYPAFTQEAGPFMTGTRYTSPNGGGLLQIGAPGAPVPASATVTISFKDSPFATSAIASDGSAGDGRDPQQYGHGLIVLGQFVCCGAVRTPFVRCTAEPKAGDMSIGIQSGVTGWLDGDALYLADTRTPVNGAADNFLHFDRCQCNGAVSGTTVTIKTGAGVGGSLKFTHNGGYDYTNTLDPAFTAPLANTTRNVIFKCATAGVPTTPPHVYFSDFAFIDCQYATFDGFGRTSCRVLDDTTYSANPNPAAASPNNWGSASHFGSNIDGRRSCNFYNLVGRANQTVTVGGNPYICRFYGNYITDYSADYFFNTNPPGSAPGSMGLTLRQTNFGYFGGNLILSDYGAGGGRCSGSGFFVDGAGEYDNWIDSNYVSLVIGNGTRGDDQSYGPATQGDGFYLASPGNKVTNNIACMTAGTANGLVHGFNIWLVVSVGGFVDNVQSAWGRPHVAGEDPTNWITHSPNGDGGINPRQYPLNTFSGNEAFGCASPYTDWYVSYEAGGINVNNRWTSNGTSTILNFKAWNFSVWTFGYQKWNVTYYGYKTRASKDWNPPNGNGYWPGDYDHGKVTFQNCDIQGCNPGMAVPGGMDIADGNFKVINCTFANIGSNIIFYTPWSVAAGGPAGNPVNITLSNNTLITGGLATATTLFTYGFMVGGSFANILIPVTVTVVTGGHTYACYDNNQDGNANQDGGGFVYQTGAHVGGEVVAVGAPAGATHYTNTSLLAFIGKCTYNAITPGGAVSKPWLSSGKAVQTS